MAKKIKQFKQFNLPTLKIRGIESFFSVGGSSGGASGEIGGADIGGGGEVFLQAGEFKSPNFVKKLKGWMLENTGKVWFQELYAGSASNYLSYDKTNGLQVVGKITATTGEIGGFTIGATTIYSAGNEIILDSANKRITVGASDKIFIDGDNKRIQSDNYVTGYAGAGFHLSDSLLEVGNIACRGLIRTSVFQKDVISTVGGNLMVLDGDVLDVDMTAADNSTLTTKATTTFSVGDILRIKDGADDEWLEVTAVNEAVYTCTRDKASDYGAGANPAWKKGATVVNYGQSGDGGIFMTASETNAPYLSVFTHAGSPWTDLTTRLRIGNLNGYLGYATDKYGIAIGETNKYLKYDPTNGLRIAGTMTASTINIPNATSPLFSVDINGNVVANSLRRNDFHWFTLFESADGYSASGVGTATVSSGGMKLQTGGISESTVDISKIITTGSGTAFSWTKKRSIKFSFYYIDNNTGIVASVVNGNIDYANLSNRGFGFYFSGATIYSIVGNGTNHTKNNIGTITANSTKEYEAILTPGVNVKFYINGTLVDTITTYLPADSYSNYILTAGIKNYTSANRQAVIGFYDFWQAS